MSRLADLINELCPDGVEYRRLDELFATRNGYTPSRSDASAWDSHDIPWFRMEDIRENGGILDRALTYISSSAVKNGVLFPENSLLVATSATIGAHALITVPHLSNQRFTSLRLKDEYRKYFDYRFLYYYCFVLDAFCLEHVNVSSFPSVDMRAFRSFKFPFVPLAVQREIVRILDQFTTLEAELEAELEARQAQYEYYRNQLLSYDALASRGPVEWVKLGEVAIIATGKHNTSDAIENGIYPFYVRSQTPLSLNDYDFDEAAVITAGDGVGVGRVFHHVEGKYALHQRAYRIVPEQTRLSSLYLYHLMVSQFSDYLYSTVFKSSVTSLRKPMLERFPVALPTLQEQCRIADVLDRFDALVNDISSGLPAEIAARRAQYEYYRDRLLSFPEKK
mgnify:CR=1 FL=1